MIIFSTILVKVDIIFWFTLVADDLHFFFVIIIFVLVGLYNARPQLVFGVTKNLSVLTIEKI